ncbi:hypothetical protein MA16_Dca011516 [Dendrobium catenatum]|uniref:Uncharacterized protein n=1 Tax=Dendrobium catenatum TaxID=906689 RepID=A0A2I0VFR7_9ASPA|nr:hypothetical protein MA16_Dca011516 [Dendrobium catenatum]
MLTSSPRNPLMQFAAVDVQYKYPFSIFTTTGSTCDVSLIDDSIFLGDCICMEHGVLSERVVGTNNTTALYCYKLKGHEKLSMKEHIFCGRISEYAHIMKDELKTNVENGSNSNWKLVEKANEVIPNYISLIAPYLDDSVLDAPQQVGNLNPGRPNVGSLFSRGPDVPSERSKASNYCSELPTIDEKLCSYMIKMAVGIRMKRRVVDKYADRRRNKNIVGAKGHGGRYNMEDSDGEVFARVEELAHLPNMSVKGRNLRSSIKQSEKRFARREENDSELSSWRMRRSVVSKDVGRERKSFFGVRKERGKDVDAAKKGKAGDARLFAGKPLRAMRKVADEDFSDYEHNGGDFYRRRERSMKTEASAGKIRLKRRKFDVELAEDSPRCDAESVELEKHAVTKDGENQNSEQKPIRRPTRVLDKTGKKIRVQTKAMEKGSTETSVSKKTTRRVIKIDPYDISNKRLDDGVPKSDIAVEKETVVSMNAQFRAIQPSAGILSFVEENVFRNKLEFFAAAKMSSSFPSPTLPEIAFAVIKNFPSWADFNELYNVKPE